MDLLLLYMHSIDKRCTYIYRFWIFDTKPGQPPSIILIPAAIDISGVFAFDSAMDSRLLPLETFACTLPLLISTSRGSTFRFSPCLSLPTFTNQAIYFSSFHFSAWLLFFAI